MDGSDGGQRPLTDYVPEALRFGYVDPELMLALLPAQLSASGTSLEDSLSYLSGAQQHLTLMERGNDSAEKDVRWLSGTVDGVKTFKRESEGEWLGTKAQITFHAEDGDSETIDTGWIDHVRPTPWYDREHGRWSTTVWDMALARTIMEVAEQNTGRRVAICKHLESAANSRRVRTAVSIRPLWDGGGAPRAEEAEEAGEERRASGEEPELTPKDALKRTLGALQGSSDLTTDDKRFLLELIEDDHSVDRRNARKEIQSYLELKRGDYRELSADPDHDIDWLVQSFLLNLEED